MKSLKQAGAKIVVISADGMELRGLNHLNMGEAFRADGLLKDTDPAQFDGAILPGGVFNSDQLRVIPEAQEFISDILDSGKPLAVICHAAWALVSADLVEGRRLTSFPTIKDDIVNAGGDWVDLAVVEDDNLITSRMPSDLPRFNEAMIGQLNKATVLIR